MHIDSPYYPTHDWQTTDPPAPLTGALAAAADRLGRPQSNAAAFLAVQGGRIACERYYHGYAQIDRLHLFSVTKSVVSALIGIALGEGKLQSIDQPVLDFFPGFNPPPASPLPLLTLRHLLTMSSGMAWPLGGRALEHFFPRLLRAPDWSRFILSLPYHRAQMGVFHYSSANSHLLSLILTRATGQPAAEYAAQRLFAPLGIGAIGNGGAIGSSGAAGAQDGAIQWDADPQGHSTGGWGLHLSAREVARFGLLYLRGGRWQGQTILPEGWVEESTRLPEGAESGYGCQWWLRRIGGEPVYAALGSGGQYLFCAPARDLLVVILSRPSRRWPDRWEVIEEILRKDPSGDQR